MPVLSSAPAILSAAEVRPDSLRSRFGRSYSEAKCQPRRFCINITEDVANLLSVYRSVKVSAALTTFIVFTSKGVYDKGLETFEVTANCAACLESEKITHSLPQGPTTLDGVVNAFAGNLLDLKETGHLSISDVFVADESGATGPFQALHMEKINVEVDTFFTVEKVDWADKLEQEVFEQSLMALAADSEKDVFCDICYENVNPAQIDAVPGTKLNECGHLFCNACWLIHLRTQHREGALHMTCPGYQCDVQLEPSILLSILHVTEVTQILRRAVEEQIDSCATAKWCPRPECGRVLKLKAKSPEFGHESTPGPLLHDRALNFNVTCYCGYKLCFNCLAPAHWPARCEQAQDYLSKVATLKPIDETTEEEPTITPAAKPKSSPSKPLEVEGKLCPKCNRFIQKNGGCLHMYCKCGYYFCWGCMCPVRGHPSVCRPDPATSYKYSRRLKVHHLALPPRTEEFEEEMGRKSPAPNKPPSRRQKASMYQKALRQRSNEEEGTSWIKSAEDLAYRICRVAGKDLQFKREVLLQCGVPEAHIPDLPKNDEETQDCDLLRMPIVDHVMRYLRSAREARLALRHVTEYTFVFLHDRPDCLDKRRALRVVSDLTAFCSFSLSVVQSGANQDPRLALRRLADIQTWSRRTLEALMGIVHKLEV